MFDEIERDKYVTVHDKYYTQHPSQQQFYRVIAYIMGLFGLNTECWGWYKRPTDRIHNALYWMQRWTVIICLPITCISEVLYLVMHYSEHEFGTLAVMFSIVPVSYIVWIKSATAQTSSYKEANQALMTDIHLHNYLKIAEFDDDKRNYIAKELVNIEKNTRRTLASIMFLVMICTLSWHIVPLVHNIQNTDNIHNVTVRLEVCVHFWMPFDYEFNFYTYLFIQTLGFYCSVIAVILMVLFDTVNFAFIYHLVGHIKIIKYDLENDFKNTDLTESEIKKKLVHVTKYYCFITNTFQMVTAAYGLSVAAIYAQNLIQGGLLLYQLMTAGKDIATILTFGLMIPIFMGILLIVSLILENVRIQAEDIPALVYDIPWETMSVSNQKIVLLILNQVQPTLEFVAAFNIKTGMQPAINILKTTFSYYVMIKDSK